jgi:ribosomal protein S18 acetylase RimI-like enzyme
MPGRKANLLVRAPHATEWAACRTLIPEAFRSVGFPEGGFHFGGAPEALLAFDADTGSALGCATFQPSLQPAGRVLAELRIRVLRHSRRRGIGSSLIREVLKVAAETQATEVHARVNIVNEPDAAHFLQACGFELKSRTLTVEAVAEPLFTTISRIRKKLFANGKIPEGVRMVDVADVPVERLARLYCSLVVPELHLPATMAIPFLSDPRFADSPVLVRGDQIVGMLLIEVNSTIGRGVCTVVARAVVPEYQGGIGWANLLLLAEGFERGGKKGAVRMRFEAPRDNPDTMKLIDRAQAEITGEVLWFVRSVVPGEEQGK